MVNHGVTLFIPLLTIVFYIENKWDCTLVCTNSMHTLFKNERLFLKMSIIIGIFLSQISRILWNKETIKILNLELKYVFVSFALMWLLFSKTPNQNILEEVSPLSLSLPSVTHDIHRCDMIKWNESHASSGLK